MASKVNIMYNVGVIKIRGVLMGDEETDVIRDVVKGLIDKGIKNIVLDLSRVKWMNSNAIGMLMACYSSVQSAHGKIGLTKMSDKVLKIMSITQVHTLFDHFDSIKEAVKEYKSS